MGRPFPEKPAFFISGAIARSVESIMPLCSAAHAAPLQSKPFNERNTVIQVLQGGECSDAKDFYHNVIETNPHAKGDINSPALIAVRVKGENDVMKKGNEARPPSSTAAAALRSTMRPAEESAPSRGAERREKVTSRI